MMRIFTIVLSLCFASCAARGQLEQYFEALEEIETAKDDTLAGLVVRLESCTRRNQEQTLRSFQQDIRDKKYYINHSGPDGKSLFMYACRIPPSDRFVSYLFSRSVYRDSPDDDGLYPIHHVAYNPDPKACASIFSLFLERREDPNKRDSHGTDVLMHMILANQTYNPIATAVAAMDVDLNRLDDHGHSAVSYAAMHNHRFRIWELLAEHGADLTKTYTKDELTPLHLAARENMAEVAGAIIRAGAEIDSRDAKGMTPLMWALLQNKDPLMPKYLLQGGADVTLTNNAGATMTHAAAFGGQNAEVFQQILDAGAAPDAPMPNNPTVTPARLYAQHGEDPAVWALLSEHGADLNRKGEYEPPTLMVAIDRGVSVEHAAAMIDAGCDVNDRWEVANGSALLMACRGSSPEMITMLLDHGADASLVSAEGKGVLDYAALNPQLEGHAVVERLRSFVGD